jgi:hypothetical protein
VASSIPFVALDASPVAVGLSMLLNEPEQLEAAVLGLGAVSLSN